MVSIIFSISRSQYVKGDLSIHVGNWKRKSEEQISWWSYSKQVANLGIERNWLKCEKEELWVQFYHSFTVSREFLPISSMMKDLLKVTWSWREKRQNSCHSSFNGHCLWKTFICPRNNEDNVCVCVLRYLFSRLEGCILIEGKRKTRKIYII